MDNSVNIWDLEESEFVKACELSHRWPRLKYKAPEAGSVFYNDYGEILDDPNNDPQFVHHDPPLLTSSSFTSSFTSSSTSSLLPLSSATTVFPPNASFYPYNPLKKDFDVPSPPVPSATRSFPTLIVNFVAFSTKAVHQNYIDCVKWFGNLLFSKSIDNSITCWKPLGKHKYFISEEQRIFLEDPITIIHKYPVPDCEMWWMKFSFDLQNRYLAIGNQKGSVLVWDLQSTTPLQQQESLVLSTKTNCLFRVTGFSNDSKLVEYLYFFLFYFVLFFIFFYFLECNFFLNWYKI